MAKILMHFLVETKRPVAPHQVSGEPPGALPLASQLRQSIGHSGVAYAPVCNQAIVLGPNHRGTGEAHALLTVVNGQLCIPDHDFPGAVTPCPACMATAEWKEALAANPHPQMPVAEKNLKGGCCG